MSRIVVLGGGIAGLAAAFFLREGASATPAPEVTVLEAADRPGGKLWTRELAGRRVDVGADAFLTRTGAVAELAEQLGLGDDLVAPRTGQVYLWARGRLRPLPSGTLLGVPMEFGPLLRSGVLSPGGVLRAAMDLVLPASTVDGDRSVAGLVGTRFGRQVVETLVEPLLGGVYAGRAEELSVRATAPRLAEAAERHRSLLRGLRAGGPTTAPPAGPVFQTVAGGLDRLVDGLVERLPEVRLGEAAERVEADGEGYRVRCASGEWLDADGVVVALPASEAADVLDGLATDAAVRLRTVPYASMAIVSLAFTPSDLPGRPRGSGVLVPRTAGRTVKAATFQSSKWPHLDSDDVVLLRASVGRAGDDIALTATDAELLAAVRRDLADLLGIGAEPLDALVSRWPRGLPQYTVGHRERVEAVRTAVARNPRLHLTGAAYDGVGIPACVELSRRVAARLRRELSPGV